MYDYICHDYILYVLNKSSSFKYGYYHSLKQNEKLSGTQHYGQSSKLSQGSAISNAIVSHVQWPKSKSSYQPLKYFKPWK